MKTSSTATTAVPSPIPTLPSIPGGDVPISETSTILLLLGFLLLIWASRSLRQARARLPAAGAIPRIASWSHLFVRAAAILIAVQVFLRLIPDAMSPAVPWVLVAAAVALGWSSRDLLPDVIAGIVLEVERKVRPGDWINTDGISGTVQSIGFRASTVLDARGRLSTVPNRHLIVRTVAADHSPWPEVELTFAVEDHQAGSDVERLIREAALVLPWIAPAELGLVRTETGYRLRARVLDGRFIDAFATTLRHRVEEALKAARLV